MSKVEQFTADLGPAGWNELLPIRQSRPTLQNDIDADYLIVGAGFAGLSAARRIMQLDSSANIVLLEARQVGEGPSGRNSGFMIDLPHDLSSSNYSGQATQDLIQTRMNRVAIEFARDMVDSFQLPKETFSPVGKINAAAGKPGLKNNYAYAKHLDSIGEPSRLLDTAEMQALTGSDYYQGGLWTPGTAIIQPAMYIRGIADGLVTAGCRLFEQSPVIGLKIQGDRWRISTQSGSVNASKTILAVNGLVENFGFYRHRLMHINLYASMTRELSEQEVNQLGGESTWAFTPADPIGSSLRRISGTGGHRLLIRNRCTYEQNLKLPDDRLQHICADHDRSFYARFPMLKQVSMEYRWSGRLCLSRNNAWAIGEVGKNLFSACCQNGLGATRGTIAGIAAAEMACEKYLETLLPGYPYKTSPKKLFPEPFTSLGARNYLKYKEWRAGREL
jgi:glycine/D-amino acid oxidase-like deaminating enzyme